jgi:hypothetical protein
MKQGGRCECAPGLLRQRREWRHIAGDVPVEEPICCCCHGERLGTDFEGENLSRDDPGNRSLIRRLAVRRQ